MMKRSRFGWSLLVAVCMLGLAGLAWGQSNQVIFSYADFSQTVQTGRKLYLYPLWLSATQPAGLTTRDRRTAVTDLTGQAVLTNMLAGLYRGEFQGVWQPTTNWFTVWPTNTGTVWASNLVANAYVLAGSQIPAYSMPQADARFAPIGSVSHLLTGITNGVNGLQTDPNGELIPAASHGFLQANGGSMYGSLFLWNNDLEGSSGSLNIGAPASLLTLNKGFTNGGATLDGAGNFTIAGTMTAQNFAGMKLATIQVFPDGTYLQNGQLITATNTTTAGLQEAINALPMPSIDGPGGGKVVLAPGVFWITETITNPPTSIAFNLTLEGAGMTATAIVQASAMKSALRIGYPSSANATCFFMRNLCLAGASNSMTNIVFLNGDAGPTGLNEGGIGRAWISECYFTYWGSATNTTPPGFTPSMNNDTLKHNLVGLDVNCNYNDTIGVVNSSFSFLCTAIRYASDHGVIRDNCFEHCGNSNGNPSDWPSTSPYFMGAAVLLNDSAYAPTLINGNKHIVVDGNNFIGCSPHYALIYPYNTGAWKTIGSICIYNDTDEPYGVPVATYGFPVHFVNPRGWSWSVGDPSILKSMLLTNITDFTYWNSPANVASTNLVTRFDYWNTASGVTTNYALPGGSTLYITNGIITGVR